MSHYGFGTNISFLNEKMKIGFCSGAFCLDGPDGQPCHTQIHHARDVAIAIAFPVDPHIIPRLDPRVESSGPGWYLLGHAFTHIKPEQDIQGLYRRLGSGNISQRIRRDKSNRAHGDFCGFSNPSPESGFRYEGLGYEGLVDAGKKQRYAPPMKVALPSIDFFKRILGKVTEFFKKPTDVRYTSVPIWRPWRRF